MSGKPSIDLAHSPKNPTNESSAQRQNIYILFAEFTNSETSAAISYLRNHQFAPHGKNIATLEQLLAALTERSWDIIICKSQQSSFDPYAMTKQLRLLEKDIPVLQLIDDPDQGISTQALLNDIQAILPTNDYPLLLLHIQREYSHLERRRQLRLIQLQLSENQKRCRVLMDQSTMAICFIYNQNMIYLNDTFCKLFGYQLQDQLLNKSILNCVAFQEKKGLSKLISSFVDSGQTKQPYQLLARRADNSNFTAHIALQQTHFNDMECIEITIENNRNLSKQSKFDELDPITGLYNLEYFSDALENSLRHAQQGGNDCQLIFIDVLNIPIIRSQLGTEASKTLARDTADILNIFFVKAHIKARLSEQIFAVIYSDPNIKKTLDIANSLYSRLGNHGSNYRGQLIQMAPAIALVPITDTATSVNQILERGQQTILQCAKLTVGEPKILTFDINGNQDDTDRQQSVDQITSAIIYNNLRLLFQPLVPLVFNSELQHYEVLLRMIGPENQSIPPAQFLANVKHANLNERMDRWVITQSIQHLRHELDKNKQLKLFISVTDTIWEHEALLLWIAETLRKSRIQADHLVIQISETESANSLSSAKHFVDGLRKLNCLICLKHYGSTQDSKNILKTLDPDYIKFDASFIHELSESNNFNNSFEDLLGDLNSLGKISIATQVETPKVMNLLWKSGVGMVQGYYLQAPDENMDYDFIGN
ncbi:MAG: EAL domain-containing protein [Oceanospirillaceae bacterium]